MSITYNLNGERRRITVTAAGPITADDVLAIVDRQIADHAWSYALLYDALEAQQLPQTADLARIADHVRSAAKHHGRRGPVAVVSKDSAILATARQYAGVEASVGPVAFFTTRQDAERWLRQQLGHPE